MTIYRKWREELIALAWINISLVVTSFPLFAIYIVTSLQGGNVENYVLHTERGQHFVEVIAKYFAAIFYWIPLSILMKIGAAKPSVTLMKTCSVGTLVFTFLLALQLIVQPPDSILVVCAYAVSFGYLLTTAWLMKKFMEEFNTDKMRDLSPVVPPPFNNGFDNGNCVDINLDELNDVADQQYVFRLQPMSKCSSGNNTITITSSVSVTKN